MNNESNNMKQQEITDRVRLVGQKLIDEYLCTGHVHTGINGPYDDPETEVRYLSHLIVIAAVEYLKFGNKTCDAVVERLGNQVLKMKNDSGVYKMRQKKGKDQCNGVIGHAWLIEGLIYAYKVTKDKKYLIESERICGIHKFNRKLALWCRPQTNSIDFTFNHQLWYAASLAELLCLVNNDELRKQLDDFIDSLPHNLTINSNGRIAHAIYSRPTLKDSFLKKISRLKDVSDELLGLPNLCYRESGYHVFNLMAFARLYISNIKSDIFESNRFKKAIDYVTTDYFQNLLLDDEIKHDRTLPIKTLEKNEKSINIYGYPYNVPGFEIMFCQEAFKNKFIFHNATQILQTQIEETWNPLTQMFDNKCHDKVVVNYRTYEYYRYLEIIAK